MRSPGRGRKLQCLLLLTKEECSGSQNVFKGEVAKIITRVWEENQGVAGPQRRLGGSNKRWRQHASTSKAAALRGIMHWEGRHAARGTQRASGGLRALFLFLRSVGCLEVRRCLGYSVQFLDKGGNARPQREQNRNRSPPTPRPFPPQCDLLPPVFV